MLGARCPRPRPLDLGADQHRTRGVLAVELRYLPLARQRPQRVSDARLEALGQVRVLRGSFDAQPAHPDTAMSPGSSVAGRNCPANGCPASAPSARNCPKIDSESMLHRHRRILDERLHWAIAREQKRPQKPVPVLDQHPQRPCAVGTGQHVVADPLVEVELPDRLAQARHGEEREVHSGPGLRHWTIWPDTK